MKPPFKMANAVTDLEIGLTRLGVTHDLILVPHSFAGEIATYLAAKHPDWIAGGVLVDSNVPAFFTNAEIHSQNKDIQPQIAKMLATQPGKESRTMSAIGAAFVEMSQAFHGAAWPKNIPCIVIVSEKTPFSTQPDADRWTRAHLAFTHDAPNRSMVIARGSSHDVVHDRPDVIVQAIQDLIDRNQAKAH